MVEFPEDMRSKIKSFRTAPYFNLDADSFVIKDVVLEYLATIGDSFISQRSVFKLVDDSIYSKRFLNFQRRSKVIKKNDDDFFNLH
jgi:hypothetical protein